MKKIEQKILFALYYSFFRRLPYQPIQGYKSGNALRSWCARKLFKQYRKNIMIKSMAYFGTGVHIGNHVIIGANSVDIHDIPDYSVAAGSPARVVRKRK
ncbi:MAG: hypothetical protein IKC46_08085 [Lachnospiraceae bacterium]|nr:hypothetical protein [Lachnospiraceae bacterium]